MKHPMQPIEKDEHGVVRFKKNNIVRLLLEAGPLDLNQLAMMHFSKEDREQLMQLIGYSVSGFGELDYVSRESVEEADRQADILISAQHIARMILELGPMDRAELLNDVLPKAMCVHCGYDRRPGERPCQCNNDE